MSLNHQQPQSGADSSAPSNRAARRAQRKGKAASAPTVSTNKHRAVRQSQVMAQPHFKGRRGNR